MEREENEILGARKAAKNGAYGTSKGRSSPIRQKATILSNRVIFILTNTTHALNIMYMLLCYVSKKYSLLCRLKNTPRDRETEHAFILGSLDCAYICEHCITVLKLHNLSINKQSVNSSSKCGMAWLNNQFKSAQA